MVIIVQVVRELDKQGRLVIPKKWREKYLRGRKVVLKLERNEIRVIPLQTKLLTDYFGSLSVDLESDLSDWHSVRRELKKG